METRTVAGPGATGGIRTRSRLRIRMAISYVAVTLVIVLLLEALVVGLGLYIFTASPVVGFWAMQSAGATARVYALQAAVYAGDSGLDPNTTFQPGHPTSLNEDNRSGMDQAYWFGWQIPYFAPGSTNVPNRAPLALLIGPNEHILASSYPDRYPPSVNAAELVFDDMDLIRAALAGQPNSEVRQGALVTYASVAETVSSRDGEPLGAVYIRVPAGGPPDTNIMGELFAILIPSGLVWLCLMLPIGLVFGVLTTRGLIRRIERLAAATAKFREGDTAIRVPVGRADEIGQLEGQFNAMAEQLVQSFEQRRALAEQSARREERARIEQEMSSAHYIQRSLLPEQLPTAPGWQLQTLYQPAREVGGDWYDFINLPDGRLGIVVGDASGKGVPSALIMATACAMLRTAGPAALSPGRVLAMVNNLLINYVPSGTFATCFYATLDPDCGRLCYANAGHNLPYMHRDGQVHELRATGMPLGLMPDQDYPEFDVTIDGADCVLFYTDGLVEAHDAEREMFGTHRVKRRLQTHAQADGIIESLYNDLMAFTGPAWEQEDDVTLILLRKAD